MEKYLLIITAGGVGKRFGKSYPKQLEKILDKEIILKTAEFFEKFPPIECVITYPEDHLDQFEKVLKNLNYKISFVKGGKERFNSVKNAVNFLNELGYDSKTPVLVHDGVRPFLNLETVRKIIENTQNFQASIPYIPISGTMRKLENYKFTDILDRTNAVTVTTPQGCQLGLLKDCFDKTNEVFTDESTMLNSYGVFPKPVRDWHFNIKITEQIDIKSAEILWIRV